jgi:hypothetical protein
MELLRTLRKLVLGETWLLPIGVVVALGVVGLLRALHGAGGWWHRGGGFVLLGLVVVALLAAVGRPGRG